MPAVLPAAALLAVAGCGGAPPKASPVMQNPEALVEGLPAGATYAVFDVERRGPIVIRLEPEAAPKTVAQFERLVRSGFYDGLEFHRVEDYLVQTGRPEGDPAPTLDGEMFGQSLRHEPGAVGLARLPTDYNSGSSQFYIMKEARRGWNQEYTLFGRVVRGMDAVRSIRYGDRIAATVLVHL
jgi:peptidyl-prolyl cis-trans isomerase B (cyclophilin B)